MPSGAAIAKHAPQGAKKKSVFRPDIQGLRTVAVVAVILDHLLGWPSGGFVGVDVFFVISGFLITGLLIREHEKTGTISFTGFYRRRIKRITPAATLVIVATVIAAYFLFARTRAEDTLWDGIWAFFFVANWNMAAQGTDYFQLGGPISPLQHYWSLAVEEQFYFVWPWLMLLVFAVVAKVTVSSPARARMAAGLTMLVIVAASFAWSLFETVNAPTWAYFSTLSRTWELGIGALIAIFAGLAAKIPDWSRPILGWVGLAGIGASLFVVSADAGFPAPFALLPVMATALVIIAGTGGEQRYMWPLTNRVSGYVGDISFSLYLWHFPFIIFAISVFGEGTPLYYISAVVGMIASSMLSYHFFEDKIRKSHWLEPNAKELRRQARHRRRHRVRTHDPVKIGAGLTALTGVVVILCVLALAPKTPPVSGVVYGLNPVAASGETTGETALQARQADVQQALAATTWPELTPSINDFADGGRQLVTPEWVSDGCLGMDSARVADPIENAAGCVYGPADASQTAVLYGDSVSISYAAGIRAALPDGWKLRVLTMSACPSSDVDANNASGGPYPECAAFRDWVEGEVAGADLLIVSQAIDAQRLASGATGDDAIAEYADGMRSTLERLAPNADQVKLISRPPLGISPATCWTPISSPSDCVTDLAVADTKMAAAYTQAAGQFENVEFLDAADWFCVGGRCPAFAGGALFRADNAHLTAAGSAALGPVLQEALFPAVEKPAASALDAIREQVRTALAATAWPETTPAVPEARSAAAQELIGDDRCMHPGDLTNVDLCTYGSGDKSAVIVGDSVAVAWMPALRGALEPEGYRVRAIGHGSCPFVMSEVFLPDRPEETDRCNAANRNIVPLINAINPDIVIVANNPGGYNALVAGQEAWPAARAEAFSALRADGRQVFVLEPPPVGKVPEECATPISSPKDCESGVSEAWTAMVEADQQAAEQAGATVINTLDWFCADGRCPIFVSGTPVRTDHIHPTATYGAIVAPVLKEALLGSPTTSG